MKNKIAAIFLSFPLFWFCCWESAAATTNLLQVYEQAVYNDSLMQEVVAKYRSTIETIPQARSSLLPSLVGKGGVSRAKMRLEDNNEPPFFTAGNFYDTTTLYTLELRQPIFNYAGWSQLKYAQSGVKQSEALYYAAVQDLIIRVANAYFAVLFAKDTLTFTQAELRANKHHRDEAQHRFDVGLVAISDVYEAKAAYDGSVAQEIAAKNELMNKEEALRQLTGEVYTDLAPFKGGVPLVKPVPHQVTDWVNVSIRQNFALLAADYEVAAAKQNITVQGAAHLPRLDAVGSYQDQRNNSFAFGPNRAATAMAGVELNFPLVQGGLVLSKTRQAHYDHQAALARHKTVYRQTIINTRQAYNNVISGISKITADRQAVMSAQKTLESMQAQYTVGTRTLVDVLDVQRDYFLRQKNLAADQYNYLNATLLLKQSAGILSVSDLVRINNWLQGSSEKPHRKKHVV